MTFSAIPKFNVGDPLGESRWLLEHYVEHLGFNQAVQALGFPMPDYPIQHQDNAEEWLSAHDNIHQAIWKAIGGSNNFDLSRVDWKNDDQMNEWLQFHEAIHTSVRTSLGL